MHVSENVPKVDRSLVDGYALLGAVEGTSYKKTCWINPSDSMQTCSHPADGAFKHPENMNETQEFFKVSTGGPPHRLV